MSRIPNSKKTVNKEKQYYLDPYFFGKVSNKGELLQCFTCDNKALALKDLKVHYNTYYNIKAETKKTIQPEKGVPIHSDLLKVFQLKSWAIIMILLKTAMHRKLSLGNCRKLYKFLTHSSIKESVLLLKLSQQKALCVQLSGHVLQIVYDKPAGLMLENGEPWQPHATDKQLDNLTKAREAKKIKRTFLPLPDDYEENLNTTRESTKEYFDDIEFEKKLSLGNMRQEEFCTIIELKSFSKIYNKGGSNV